MTDKQIFKLLAPGEDPSYEAIEVVVTYLLGELETIEDLKEKGISKYDTYTWDYYKRGEPTSIQVNITEIDLGGNKSELLNFSFAVSEHDIPIGNIYEEAKDKIKNRLYPYYDIYGRIEDENEFMKCCAFLQQKVELFLSNQFKLRTIANNYFKIK